MADRSARAWLTRTRRGLPPSGDGSPGPGRWRAWGLATSRLLPIVVLLAFATVGCVADRTRAMAASCQLLLDSSDQPAPRTFIHDAEQQLASLESPGNALTDFVRGLHDPDAMTYKPALEQCLWLLKSRQS
jgi:hypothetical protein